MLNSALIKGAGHSSSDLATQNMVFVAFGPGAASLNPEAAKPPKAFAFSSLWAESHCPPQCSIPNLQSGTLLAVVGCG